MGLHLKLRSLGRAMMFAVLAACGGESAWALDLVILKDGQTLEGTILSDVPNRHIDIRLVSGQTRRIPRADVEGVERDLPSDSADRAVMGNESRGWGSIVLGGASNLSAASNGLSGNNMNFNFNFVLKLGWNAVKMGFAWVSFAFGYDYLSNSNQANLLFQSLSQLPTHDIHLEALLTRVGQSGFYFGPGIGVAFFENPAAGLGGNALSSNLSFGGVSGYAIPLSSNLILGPSLRFEFIPNVPLVGQMTLLRYGLELGMNF